MIASLLFDLDDTLLHNDSHAFFRHYVQALAPHLAAWVPPDRVAEVMWKGSEAMMANNDPTMTTLDCFWQAVRGLGYAPEALAPAFERFYATDYRQLRRHAQLVPEARPLLEWAAGKGYELVVATNPLFPDLAIRQRLDWAGIADLRFALVTSCDNMHYAKPSLRYYQEILQLIQRQPAECLMVGNDVRLDMVAGQIGLKTYLVAEGAPPPEVQQSVDGQGSLAALRSWLERRERSSLPEKGTPVQV